MRSTCTKRRPAAKEIAAAGSGLHRREDGQAIYVVVLFLFLLAGLLFLVLNTGAQLNDKVELQNAADATAASGAAWYARGLNTVAMCNVTETQLLSMIVLLDTLQVVTPPAEECIDDLVANPPAGRDMPIDDRLSWMIVGNAAAEQQFVHQLGDIVRGVSWPEYLTYDTGVLWDCAKLMDGFSRAMIAATPLAVQREAIDVARKHNAEAGFVLPLWPGMPVEEGQFSEFKDLMQYGRIPPHGRYTAGFRLVGEPGGPWSCRRGPLVAAQPMGLLDLSRFSTLFRIVSEVKLAMMFDTTGEADDQVSLRNWEMDYDKAVALPASEIRRAWWEVDSFNCRYPLANDSSDPWTPENPAAVQVPYPPPPSGSWPVNRAGGSSPSTRTYSSMSRPNLSLYTRAQESWEGADPRYSVWYRVDRSKTASYSALGIIPPHPSTHPDGTRWPYTEAEKKTYFRVTLWRFNGAELEADTTLHRDYLPPAGEAPLAPVYFDETAQKPTTDNIRTYFTFNGFAYRAGAVRDWASRFSNPNPLKDTIAYAQARVYMDGHYTWDLFTQCWKAKLVRTARWKEDLVPLLDAAIPPEGAAVAGELTEERRKPVRDMLQAYDTDFILEVTH